MKKKFTEGEWVIDKQRDTVCIDILCNNEVVATCWDDYDCVDQLRANAQLIAAAPSLLEALISLYESLPDGYASECLPMVRKAIKKATE